MGLKRIIGLLGFHFFAERLKNRFMAGETIEEAVARAKLLQQRGEKSTINILGEHAENVAQANKFCKQVIALTLLLAREGMFDVNIAVKPSSIGLDVSYELYKRNNYKILSTANYYLPRISIETDAEEDSYRGQVLETALDYCSCFPNQIVACQINRKDAMMEIEMLARAGISVRLCKGAYPGDITKIADLRRSFLVNAKNLAHFGMRPFLATHDLFLIDAMAERFAAHKDKFEFELLMGIEENLSKESHLQGFTFRRYIPCGPNWKPYGKRRAGTIVNIWLRNFLHRAVKGGEKYGPVTLWQP